MQSVKGKVSLILPGKEVPNQPALLSNYVQMKTAMDIIQSPFSRNTDFQQCGSLTSVDSSEPVQQAFKHRTSKWCSGSLTLRGYSSDLQSAD